MPSAPPSIRRAQLHYDAEQPTVSGESSPRIVRTAPVLGQSVSLGSLLGGLAWQHCFESSAQVGHLELQGLVVFTSGLALVDHIGDHHVGFDHSSPRASRFPVLGRAELLAIRNVFSDTAGLAARVAHLNRGRRDVPPSPLRSLAGEGDRPRRYSPLVYEAHLDARRRKSSRMSTAASTRPPRYCWSRITGRRQPRGLLIRPAKAPRRSISLTRCHVTTTGLRRYARVMAIAAPRGRRSACFSAGGVRARGPPAFLALRPRVRRLARR